MGEKRWRWEEEDEEVGKVQRSVGGRKVGDLSEKLASLLFNFNGKAFHF